MVRNQATNTTRPWWPSVHFSWARGHTSHAFPAKYKKIGGQKSEKPQRLIKAGKMHWQNDSSLLLMEKNLQLLTKWKEK